MTEATTPDGDAHFVLEGSPVIMFQPTIELSTGRLLGFEALVRWNHPKRGHIPPRILIPWAESNNEILSLNAWVLAEACRQAQQWPGGIALSVNCSIVQLQQQQGAAAVAAALEESGLDPDRLSVEVSETTVTDGRAAEDLRAMARLGIHLSVENVGTSMSSLDNVQQVAIETAKIDKSFTSNLELHEGMNRTIVEAIIHLSHSLSMNTVAVGVETAQQVAVVQALGADVAQGFFFAAPMPPEGAKALASTEPRITYALSLSPAFADDEPAAKALDVAGVGDVALLPPPSPSDAFAGAVLLTSPREPSEPSELGDPGPAEFVPDDQPAANNDEDAVALALADVLREEAGRVR
jgi:EAL domain-containing protein (putative c-di-GMP-specific phosphodiesterase class I)